MPIKLKHTPSREKVFNPITSKWIFTDTPIGKIVKRLLQMLDEKDDEISDLKNDIDALEEQVSVLEQAED